MFKKSLQVLAAFGLTRQVAGCALVAVCAVAVSGPLREAVGADAEDPDALPTAIQDREQMSPEYAVIARRARSQERADARATGDDRATLGDARLLEVLDFQSRFAAADPSADIDGNGEVDAFDFSAFSESVRDLQ